MDKQKNFMTLAKDEHRPKDVISHQHEESKGSDKIFSFMDNKGHSHENYSKDFDSLNKRGSDKLKNRPHQLLDGDQLISSSEV